MIRRVGAVLLALAFVAAACGARSAVRAGLDVPPSQPDMSGYALKKDMPAAATVTPPGTAVDSVQGSAVQYARADHTHATSVQRTRMAVTPAGQPVRWTFAKPYDAGVIPVVTCTAQTAVGATRPFVVNTVGDPTATYADIIVFQAAAPNLSLGNLSLTLFGAAPTGTTVNCQAAKPTQ